MNKHALSAALAGLALVEAVLLFAKALLLQNVPLVNYIQATTGSTYTPLGTQPQGEAATGVLYLIPTIAFTFVLAIGLKRNPRVWVKVAFGVAFAFSSFLIAFTAYWWWLGFDQVIALLAVLSSLFIVAFYVKSDKVSAVISAPYKIWLAVGVAFLLFIVLPFWTIIAICSAAAVWDVYAVLRGPLKSIVSSGPSTMNFLRKSMMVDFGLGGIGLGDLTFYSLLIMLALSFGDAFSIAGFISIGAGVLLTYYLLKSNKIKALPGLPLPVLFFMLSFGAIYLA